MFAGSLNIIIQHGWLLFANGYRGLIIHDDAVKCSTVRSRTPGLPDSRGLIDSFVRFVFVGPHFLIID